MVNTGLSCSTEGFRCATQSPIQPRYLHAAVSFRVQFSALFCFWSSSTTSCGGSVLLFADYVTLISARSQYFELHQKLEAAFQWSGDCDLPLNAPKCSHISIGGPPPPLLWPFPTERLFWRRTPRKTSEWLWPMLSKHLFTVNKQQTAPDVSCSCFVMDLQSWHRRSVIIRDSWLFEKELKLNRKSPNIFKCKNLQIVYFLYYDFL